MAEDVVQAKRFEIVDDRGRVRAAIGPGPNGQTGMQFYGAEGEVRVELSVGEDGRASFSLRSPSGEDLALLSVGEDAPQISLTHTGEGGSSWGVGLVGVDQGDRDVRPSLVLSEGGKANLLVTLLEADVPAILMRDGDDLVRVVP